MFWQKLSRIKGLLIIFLAILCFLDLAISYYLLKNFPLDFKEANPITNDMIKKFGLEYSLLIISPAVYFICFLLLYFFWDLCCKENYVFCTVLTSIGCLLVILLRLGAVSWNFYKLYGVFA